ncbi:MAG TPA: type III-B CRISPR module RAMP protein Cmr1 [Candidatus Nocardiopsis merdipullorum]|nr:type III-B CRISPR module RAMP protein Cmr1 [Candidatus Nocardiopsis merdipullorum]
MWTTLKLQVTTPVFNSATPPGEGYLQARPEIRVTSLRGGMRYWLRAMAGTYVGDDLHRLRAVEDRVLGSTKHASPIRLRIPRQPAASEKELRELVPDREQEQWVAYLLGPGLTTKGRAHTKDFIPPDEVFSLQVRLMGNDQESKDAHRCALAALWLNLTYGGLGARVHRGFGGLRVLGAEKGLPWDSDPTLIRSPDLAHYTKAEHLLFTGPAEESREALQRICDATWDPDGDRPKRHIWEEEPTSPYPVLGKDHTLAGINGTQQATIWPEVLAKAGQELRYFRARHDSPTPEGYDPPIKTEGWVDVIHDRARKEKHLPMAGLGLPLVYKDQYEVRATKGRNGEVEQLRRASPLWLRVVGEGNKRRLFSFAFWNVFLPESASVDLWKGNTHRRQLTVDTQDAHALVEEWIDGLRSGTSFIRRPSGITAAYTSHK